MSKPPIYGLNDYSAVPAATAVVVECHLVDALGVEEVELVGVGGEPDGEVAVLLAPRRVHLADKGREIAI